MSNSASSAMPPPPSSTFILPTPTISFPLSQSIPLGFSSKAAIKRRACSSCPRPLSVGGSIPLSTGPHGDLRQTISKRPILPSHDAHAIARTRHPLRFPPLTVVSTSAPDVSQPPAGVCLAPKHRGERCTSPAQAPKGQGTGNGSMRPVTYRSSGIAHHAAASATAGVPDPAPDGGDTRPGHSSFLEPGAGRTLPSVPRPLPSHLPHRLPTGPPIPRTARLFPAPAPRACSCCNCGPDSPDVPSSCGPPPPALSHPAAPPPLTIATTPSAPPLSPLRLPGPPTVTLSLPGTSPLGSPWRLPIPPFSSGRHTSFVLSPSARLPLPK